MGRLSTWLSCEYKQIYNSAVSPSTAHLKSINFRSPISFPLLSNTLSSFRSHCADLNGSVIQVGRVARQFSDAVSKVRQLRKQVRDIQDTLGAAHKESSAVVGASTKASRPQNAAAMSLRELWMKKLECEATLALLDRLDVIRAAPSQFDQLIQPPLCRIGAGVLTLTRALQTMFSDDIAQVQALHKIMEQLMLRKQKAEEIVWDTISDVVYLRTGNGIQQRRSSRPTTTTFAQVSSGHSVSSESRRSGASRSLVRRAVTTGSASVVTTTASVSGIVNPFEGNQFRYATDDADDDASVESDASGASLFSLEDEMDDATETGKSMISETSSIVRNKRTMIPIPMIEAELDLEADERRCLEEVALSGMGRPRKTSTGRKQRELPRYADPVLALRILVECLAQLGRLDDVERVLSENMEQEIRQLTKREQARTFARLEKKRAPVSIRVLGKAEHLQDFRRHLTGLLSAFGCVIIRLSHLAEVLRIRIVSCRAEALSKVLSWLHSDTISLFFPQSSDRDLLKKIESPSSIMRSVISSATEIMHKEIKEFLKACLHQDESTTKDLLDNGVGEGSKAYESGLFSLGIADTAPKNGPQGVSTATRSNVMEMSTKKFVAAVLFPKTRATPQVRHALTFRRSVARWSSEIDALKKELATLTGEDTSAPSFQSTDETAITFLDNVIQKDLLPVLQEEAVNGTVLALEKREAFDPVLGRTLYTQSNSSDPQDIEMCIACQAMYHSSGPLFLALHRLPKGGEMYLPLVAVLEHVMLTFTSRVKQQIGKICDRKTALRLLLEEGKGSPFTAIMERRRPCSLLSMAYADGDILEAATSEKTTKRGITPLSPPETDTASRNIALKNEPAFEDVGEGVDGEEHLMSMELQYLKPYLDFDTTGQISKVVLCTDEELMKAACLAHSLLKLASLLESRLKIRGHSSFNRALTSTRALREAIKTIKLNGMRMAKFCRIEMLMQVATRMSKIAHSSTLVARDAVRIPSSVNDLGEYLTGASDNLREAAGNAVTAYTFSSLEQYIPFCLMQTVRVLAAGNGVVQKSPLTMNGIEALDRSGSVLYRDLKGATSFDNSHWDMELAAISFERSASFMAMSELEMEELVAYYTANQEEFSEEDFALMFSMNGPRRRGDIGRFHMAKKNLGN